MRRFCVLFSVVAACGLLLGSLALGQSVPVSGSGTVDVTLGHSAVALNGPWRFHTGDDSRWASPDFDDSSWETTDVGVKADSYDPNMGSVGFVPGWTGKGHSGYSGYAWYRMRLHLSGAAGQLSLLAPSNVDDAYQIFVNGALIGAFGDFSGPTPTIFITQPRMFEIPASVLRDSTNGDVAIAFRFYMTPRSLLQIDPGGMHGPPYIGFTDAIVPVYHVNWEHVYRTYASGIFNCLIYLLFTLLLFMLYAFDRTERILLLPLAACAVSGLDILFEVFSSATPVISAGCFLYVASVLVLIFQALWAIIWWAYFSLQQKKWIRGAIIILFALRAAIVLLFSMLTTDGPKAPHFIFTAVRMSGYLTDPIHFAILVLIAYFGIRKAQKVDWMLLLALIFDGLPSLAPVYQVLHIRTAWFPFGLDLRLSAFTSLASLFCFSVVLMRRFRASLRRQQAIELDVKQAQEVQQVLIPEDLPEVPGLRIESEYRPAREVGGDFYQIIPHASDGSVLIVVGDVAGKGLQAGMLVALIVGVIRTAVEKSADPLDVIETLNRRLCGRGNSHATCLALRIAADGSVTVANAGHMPLYLNGKELPMEGALPLGMVPDAEFPVMRFEMKPEDRLMLLSDGVAEAQDEEGRLFGFERVRELLASPVTAAEVAAAAHEFGQQDDISVVSISLAPVGMAYA